MKRIFILMMLLILSLPSFVLAKSIKHQLSQEEIKHLKDIKQSVMEVDSKTMAQSIAELEKSPNPKVYLQIKEAMAKTYQDIVAEQDVKGMHKKQWLYSMVALNMAYLQFEGNKDSAGNVQSLNKLIRYKLKTYLPANIFNQPGFQCNLG